MIRHPKPAVIARLLRRFADTLDDEGDKAVNRAAILACRGYPSSSGGGARGGNSECTSTERAVGLVGDDGDLTPPRYSDIDDLLAKKLRVIWQSVLSAEDTVAYINSQAADDDQVPVGTGQCIACPHFCRPSKRNPNDRRRLELCPNCYRSFRRWLKRRPLWPTTTTLDARNDWLYERWREANPEGDREAWLKLRRAQIEAA